MVAAVVCQSLQVS